jgi:site-specific recombinase XerD
MVVRHTCQMSIPDKHLALPNKGGAQAGVAVGTAANNPALRQIGWPQMAFVRSWAEGLDLVAAWNRYLYLDGAGDARRARGELQRLLEQLRQLARVHGKPEIAALLRRDPQAMPEAVTNVPTLAEFAAKLPADFYSEAELIGLHQARFGQTGSGSTARRRQRLRERLVSAVLWLEQVGARVPQPTDPVQAWLDERIAQRLAVAGIRTLDELGFWIRTKGFHWHRRVPRIGAQGAARIVRWMAEHAGTLGPLPSPAMAPISLIDTVALTPAPRIGIVPLERFMPPSGRDGSQGTNRAPAAQCKLSASNDYEAIHAWLRLRLPGTHTWRAYRKEAERFLLWAVLERRKALSSLDGDDCVGYRDFLAAPGSEWTGPRNTQRWSEAWRPFEGPLSVRSQATAMVIVRSLCEWLVRRHYLDSNPWDDVPARPDAPSMPQLRALSQKQWDMVQSWLADEAARAPSPALHRLGFLLNFSYMSGMRLAELAAARLGWLRHEQLDDGEWAWSIMVLGKRNKWREVPLPDKAMDALQAFLALRGLSPDPLANDPETALISQLALEAPLSAARIYDILVDAFERCAVHHHARNPRAAERIRQASTHWLRHTYGSHSAARGVPQDVLQANLGHESPATTSIYVRAEKARKHRAMQQAFGKA